MRELILCSRRCILQALKRGGGRALSWWASRAADDTAVVNDDDAYRARRGKVFAAGELKKKSLDLLIGVNAALCSVDRPCVRDFVADLCDWTSPQSRQSGLRGLSRRSVTDLLKLQYEERQEHLELVRVSQPHPITGMVLGFHVGFDCYSDITRIEWIALTLSFCSIDGKLFRVLGDVMPMMPTIDSATAAAQRKMLNGFLNGVLGVLGEHASVGNILRTATADNASAAQAVFNTRDTSHKRVGCFDHKVQLCCTDQLPHKTSAGSEVAGLSPLLTTVLCDLRTILNKFAKSNKVMQAYVRKSLELFDGEVVMMPVYDVVTRCDAVLRVRTGSML